MVSIFFSFSFIVFFFFKQKTAYEMRISDWSSDVCSSDLHLHGRLHFDALSGIAAMIDPVGHLRQFQRIVDLLSPPLPDRLDLDRCRRSHVELARLRP